MQLLARIEATVARSKDARCRRQHPTYEPIPLRAAAAVARWGASWAGGVERHLADARRPAWTFQLLAHVARQHARERARGAQMRSLSTPHRSPNHTSTGSVITASTMASGFVCRSGRAGTAAGPDTSRDFGRQPLSRFGNGDIMCSVTPIFFCRPGLKTNDFSSPSIACPVRDHLHGDVEPARRRQHRRSSWRRSGASAVQLPVDVDDIGPLRPRHRRRRRSLRRQTRCWSRARAVAELRLSGRKPGHATRRRGDTKSLGVDVPARVAPGVSATSPVPMPTAPASI